MPSGIRIWEGFQASPGSQIPDPGSRIPDPRSLLSPRPSGVISFSQIPGMPSFLFRGQNPKTLSTFCHRHLPPPCPPPPPPGPRLLLEPWPLHAGHHAAPVCHHSPHAGIPHGPGASGRAAAGAGEAQPGPQAQAGGRGRRGHGTGAGGGVGAAATGGATTPEAARLVVRLRESAGEPLQLLQSFVVKLLVNGVVLYILTQMPVMPRPVNHFL